MIEKIEIALPKGRLYNEVEKLLADAGLNLTKNERNYRPLICDPEIEVKILKTQNIPRLVELGSQDIAFCGRDWVIEQDADVEEIMDLGFNRVRVVAAIPDELVFDQLKLQTVRVASEYENISRRYLEALNIDFVLIKSYGATEVFVPEDADMIIDNTSTGKTLRANNLKIIDELMTSSTCMIANKESLKHPWKSRKIKDIITLIRSAIEGRKRFLIEMNVAGEDLDRLIPLLPCMKSPTVAELYGEQGYAVKIAVEKEKVASLIPFLKENGATDILVYNINNVVP